MAAQELFSTTLFSDANLQAYYRAENVNDATAHARNLTNNNSVAFNPAKFNNGFDFGSSNTNKRMATTDSIGIDGGAITMSGWVNITTAPSSGNSGLIMDQGNDTSHVQNRVFYDNTAGTLSLYFRRTKYGVGNDDVNYVVTLSLGTWYHVAYVYDGATITAYVNGVSVGTPKASSGNGSSGAFIGFTTGIGQGDYNTVILSGLTDDIAIFNRALTPSEISLIVNGSSTHFMTGGKYW